MNDLHAMPAQSSAAFTLDHSRRKTHAGGLVAFLLVAFNLRLALVALAPVLTQIRQTEHISDSTAGLLTTLPLACFGVFAFLTPWLTRRLGVERLLPLAMLILAAGVSIWFASGVVTLFAGALVAGAGIGIANVVMPSMIKRDFAGRAHLVTGLYTTAFGVGGAVAAGLTVPIDRALGLGWRDTLALWSIPAVAAFLTVFRPGLMSRDTARESAAPAGGASMPALFRDRTAWAVTGFMGLQSLGYYAVTAWLPTLLQQHHMSAGRAGWLLSFTTFPTILGALATPSLNRRLGDGPRMVTIAGGLCAVGYLGLLFATTHGIYLWATCLGLGQGACVSLAIHYIVARAPDQHGAGRLSAMSQGFGYLFACLGPAAFGALHNLTSGWSIPLATLIALLVLQVIIGIRASRQRHVLTEPVGLAPRSEARESISDAQARASRSAA